MECQKGGKIIMHPIEIAILVIGISSAIALFKIGFIDTDNENPDNLGAYQRNFGDFWKQKDKKQKGNSTREVK